MGQAYFTALGPTFQQIYDPRWLLLYSHGNTPESLGIDVVLICSLKEPLKNLRRQRKRPQRHQRNLGWHVGVGVVMLLWSSQAQWLETDVCSRVRFCVVFDRLYELFILFYILDL